MEPWREVPGHLCAIAADLCVIRFATLLNIVGEMSYPMHPPDNYSPTSVRPSHCPAWHSTIKKITFCLIHRWYPQQQQRIGEFLSAVVQLTVAPSQYPFLPSPFRYWMFITSLTSKAVDHVESSFRRKRTATCARMAFIIKTRSHHWKQQLVIRSVI